MPSCLPRVPLPSGVFLSAGSARVVAAYSSAHRGGFATVAYRSLTGESELLGVSGFQPTGDTHANGDPAAPWNAGPDRKWTLRALSGFMLVEAFTGADGGGDLICYLPATPPLLAAASGRTDYEGQTAWSDAIPASPSRRIETPYGPIFGIGACVLTPDPPVLTAMISRHTPYRTVTQTLTEARTVGDGVQNTVPPDNQAGSFVHSGEAIATLLRPEREYAALRRDPGAVEGTASIASIDYDFGAIGGPESEDPLPIIGTAVQADLTFGGLARGAVYNVAVALEITPTGGGEPVVVGDAFAFSAEHTRDTVAYDLPVYTGYSTRLLWARA